MHKDLKLMAVSVMSSQLMGKNILVYSSCLPNEHPEVFEKVSEGKTPLSICMSEEHIDKVGFKLATILACAKPSSITVLTMDGSPHCTQLHTIAEQAKRITNSEVRIKHLVVEKGALVEVSDQSVYLSRHLSKIEELLKSRESPHARKNL